MTEELKKKRSPNFTNDEVILLLSIVNTRKHIVESKKTDGYTWKEKELAWQQITNQFNAECPNRICRSKESLKKCFENKKKETRKSKAEERIQNIKTGGGLNTCKTYDDPVQNLTLNIMNEKTVIGASNKFDCDKRKIYEEERSQEINTVETDVVFNTNFDSVTSCNISLNSEQDDSNNINLVESQPDWSDYKAAHLKTPLHPNLKNKKESSNNRPLHTSRRRPNSTLHSSNLSKQYTELGDVKLELAKLQVEILKADTKRRREREEEEHKLKMESMKLDILLKQAALKKTF